jgi:peroxiredoxin Q/BCP
MNVGDKIPEVLGKDQNGNEIRSSAFLGKKLVLYSYPKANTSGCTAEACSIRDNFEALVAKGYNVVGVSKDSAASHKKFIEKYDLPFTLLADTSTEMLQTFGAWGEKKMYGKTVMGTLRRTFIFDENGILTEIIEKVDTKNHAQQILK